MNGLGDLNTLIIWVSSRPPTCVSMVQLQTNLTYNESLLGNGAEVVDVITCRCVLSPRPVTSERNGWICHLLTTGNISEAPLSPAFHYSSCYGRLSP